PCCRWDTPAATAPRTFCSPEEFLVQVLEHVYGPRVTPVQIRPKRKGIEPDRPAAGPEATAAGGVSGPEHATTRWKLGREETMLTWFKSRRPGSFPMKPFGKNVEGLFSLDCGRWSRVGTGSIDSAVCERIVRPSSHFPFASDLLR